MDFLLSLPQDFSMGLRRGERRDLLNAPSFVDPAIAILQKADTSGPDYSKGGIKALQKQIAKRTRILRERFQP